MTDKPIKIKVYPSDTEAGGYTAQIIDDEARRARVEDQRRIVTDSLANAAASVEALPPELRNLGSAITHLLDASDTATEKNPFPLSLAGMAMLASAQLLAVAEMYNHGRQRLGVPDFDPPEDDPDALPAGAPEEARDLLAAADLLAAFYLRQLPDVTECMAKLATGDNGPQFGLTAEGRARIDTIIDDFIDFAEVGALPISEATAQQYVKAQDDSIAPETLEKLSSIIPGSYVIPNNKAVRMAVNPAYAEALIGDGLGLIVISKGKKHRGPGVETVLQLTYEGDNVNITGRQPFTSYDRIVYNALSTLFVAGDPSHLVTPAMVWRAMVGASETENPSPQQLGAVTKSIDKMRFMRARIDCSAELAHYGATLDGMPISNGIVDTYLLNASGVTVSAGGRSVTAYRITDAPILYTYASKIKQVITVPARLLDVRRVERDGKTTGPRIATTESRLLIRDHLLNRISGMKGDNKLENRVIALNSYDRNGQRHIGLYEAAGYKEPAKIEAKRVREYAAQVLTYWAAIGWIKGHSMKRTGREITGIEIKL